MIRFERVSVTYPGAGVPAVRDVQLELAEGELTLIVGRTGSGKSTLLRAVNGLVPHFTGGTLAGRVVTAGRDTRTNPPRELADVVGVVGQDPSAGFVTDNVEEELAYGMEQLALPPAVMRKRVEETLDLLGIAGLRHRSVRTLSGGEQQRVAIGAVLTAHPAVLVLDEPTSALDPTAAEEVLAVMTRLVHDLGTTVVVAEHRLERVVQHADSVVEVGGDGRVDHGAPGAVLATSGVAPPVVALGRLAGWEPLPLSVREARRRAPELRSRLGGGPPPAARTRAGGTPALSARRVVVRHGRTVAVREVSLDLWPGEITALMGRNGSGKSSLLWALQGAGPRQAGTVEVAGQDPSRLRASEGRRLVALVPQNPGDLLYLDSVDAECAEADRAGPGSSRRARALLDRFAPGVHGGAHPRDLSEGQRLALAVALQLAAGPDVLLLDEPTRGLDYAAKAALSEQLVALAAEACAVVVATHDVEFVAGVAHRVVVMATGDVVADGSTPDVVTASPAFAPQVARILAPAAYLTVAEVASALAVRA